MEEENSGQEEPWSRIHECKNEKADELWDGSTSTAEAAANWPRPGDLMKMLGMREN